MSIFPHDTLVRMTEAKVLTVLSSGVEGKGNDCHYIYATSMDVGILQSMSAELIYLPR